jgi:hypothetical protein
MLSKRRSLGLLLLMIGLAWGAHPGWSEAGWPQRRAREVVVTPTSQVRPYSRPPIGTFVPAPYIYVRGNGTSGGGYSPMGMYGPDNLALQGPFSPMRSIAAPVLVYNRGFDGVVRPSVETSFSNPNMPRLSPVVYPTRANNVNGFRSTTTPPWWDSGINWVDQN